MLISKIKRQIGVFLPAFLGLALLIFSYGLFVFTLPLYDLNPDYFDYYSLAFRWLKCDLGNSEGVLIDLPIGFPLLLTFQRAIGLSSLQYINCILTAAIFSYIFISVKLVRFYGYAGSISSLMLALYLCDGGSLKNLTSLMPDGPYLIVLLISFGHLLGFLNGTAKIKSLFWFTFFTLLLPVFRSNGIIVFPILLVFLGYLYLKRDTLWKKFAMFAAFLILSFSLFSFLAMGYLNYANLNRLVSLLKPNPISNSLSERTDANPHKTGYYFYAFSEDRQQFFFNQIPVRIYKHITVRKTINAENYGMYDWTTPVPENWKHQIQSEYDELANSRNFHEFQKGYFSFKSTPSIWHKGYHLIYKFYSLCLNSTAVLILFYLMLFILFISTVFRKNIKLDVFGFYAALYFLSMAFALFLIWDFEYARYAFPQDFIPLFLLPLLIKKVVNSYAP